MKKGYTIIELIVSMAIFMVAVSLVVGAFATVVRLKTLSSNMKESQQKIRIALEMVTRLSRQAEVVKVSDDGKIVDLYFDASSAAKTRFQIEPANGSIPPTLTINDCTTAGCAGATNLFGGAANLYYSTSSFSKVGTLPALLNINLSGRTGTGGVVFDDDSFDIRTSVILENLR